MATPRMPKIITSVFTKLLVIILVTGLGINLALILLFGAFRQHFADAYFPHLNRYMGYLVKELGDPPDPERARRIALETHMVITYEAPGLRWTTADGSLDLPLGRFRVRHQENGMAVSSYHGAFQITVPKGDGRLTFLVPHQVDAEKQLHILGIGLLLYITMLMAVAYLVIRRVLKPLRLLRQGVGQVSRGALSHQVPVSRSDELGDLARAFNTMTARISKLVQSKQQLLLDVSHELRTPITRMRVALAMMAQGPEKLSLEEDLKEMEQKVSELLESARAVNIKAGLDLQETDLMHLLKETAAAFNGIGPGIRVADEENAMEVKLPLDRRKIGQALKNILDNALKYSPPGSRPVEVSLALEGAGALMVVRDHGIGIPEEDLDFVFEPFYRADKSRTPGTGGYGLGLSLVRTIVEAHGGNVRISSRRDTGTTVRLFLPAHCENQP